MSVGHVVGKASGEISPHSHSGGHDDRCRIPHPVVDYGIYMPAGHSIETKRTKNCIAAHEPTRSAQPQPPPNGHLVLILDSRCHQGKGPLIDKRKGEKLLLTGGVHCWQG